MKNTEPTAAGTRVLAVISIVLGAIGWFASFELATEYIKTLQSPEYVPNCAVSILVTCGPNMDSWQGSLFGFSNTLIGLAAFVAPIVVGAALLAGAKFTAWFWWLYRFGLFLGLSLVLWLAYQSIFVINTLCPWCMVVWSVMIPLFFLTVFAPEARQYVAVSSKTQAAFAALHSWAWVCIFVVVVLIAAIAQFKLDWFAEFSR